jgi:hypothetical protein
MFRVLCVDSEKLPPGGEVESGLTYFVERKFINSFDQIVYIIQGIANEGRTKHGLPWIGYRADRFLPLEDVSVEEKEVNHTYILN